MTNTPPSSEFIFTLFMIYSLNTSTLFLIYNCRQNELSYCYYRISMQLVGSLKDHKMNKFYQLVNNLSFSTNTFKVIFIFPSLCLLLSSNLLAQQTYQVGIAVWSGYESSVQGFKEAMQQAGLIEGKNITYIRGETSASKEVQIKVANNFKQKNVDLVYSLTTPGTTIMKKILDKNTPIVFLLLPTQPTQD